MSGYRKSKITHKRESGEKRPGILRYTKLSMVHEVVAPSANEDVRDPRSAGVRSVRTGTTKRDGECGALLKVAQ